MSKLLSEAVDEFIAHRRVAFEANTARSSDQFMRKFLLLVGNVQVRHLGPQHGERFQSSLISAGLKPNSVNNGVTTLSVFSRWAIAHRYLPAHAGLTATVRHLASAQPPRLRIPAHEMTRVLDACTRPQIRIMVALGFYLFLRASEMGALRVGDVDLGAGEIQVHVKKGKTYDVMPICYELDQELRTWLTTYAQDQEGPLRPDHYLVPAHRPTGWWDPEQGMSKYVASRPIGQASRFINDVLDSCGYEIRKGGESTREGMHTLRRSGARAYYEAMLASGTIRDDILRQVMAMLHHKSVMVTERYLGLEADREKRDFRLKGKKMFDIPIAENVVRLERALEG